MGYLIIYFIIIVYASMLTILLKKRMEEVIPISIVEIILIIFISGLLDNLKIGITITEVLAILQLILIIIITLKKRKEIIENIVTPGLLVYTLFFLANIIINKDRMLENYDEFNHWGVIVKNMFLYHTYGTNEQTVVKFNEYPPFTAVFQYLFLMIQKVYREDIIIIAQNVLYFSIIIPITKNIKWDKSFLKVFLVLPLIILLPIVFYENFYLEILVDGLLGILFAYVIFSAFQEENIKFKYIKILAGEIMLVLTKTSSIGLAILAILIIFLEKIIFELKSDKEKAKKEIKLIIMVFLIKVNKAEKRWDFTQIIKTDESKTNQTSQIVVEFIKKNFLGEEITSRKFSVFSVIMLLICLQIYIATKIKTSKLIYYGIAMLLTIPIWLLGLLFMYVTIFDLREAMFLTCFDRYVSTILLANCVFQMLVILQVEETKGKTQAIIIIFVLLSLIPLSNIEEKYINGKNYIKMAHTNRYIYTQLKNYKNQLQITDKILYMVGTDTNTDYITSMNNYELMPIRIEQTIKNNFKDINHFKDMVKDYTHIFIYQIEDKKKNEIKELFEKNEVKTDVLYKVKNQNNRITLELEREKYER